MAILNILGHHANEMLNGANGIAQTTISGDFMCTYKQKNKFQSVD